MVEETGSSVDSGLQLVKDCSHRKRHTSGSSNYPANPHMQISIPQTDSYYQYYDPQYNRYFDTPYTSYQWQIPEGNKICDRESIDHAQKKEKIYEELSNSALQNSDLKPSKNCSHRRHSIQKHSKWISPNVSITDEETGLDSGTTQTVHVPGNTDVSASETQRHLQQYGMDPYPSEYYIENLDGQKLKARYKPDRVVNWGREWQQDIHNDDVLESDLKPSLNCRHRHRKKQRFSDQIHRLSNNAVTNDSFNDKSLDQIESGNSDLASTSGNNPTQKRQNTRKDNSISLDDSNYPMNGRRGFHNLSFDEAVTLQSDLKPTINCSHRRQSYTVREYMNRSWDFSRPTSERVCNTLFDDTASLHSDLKPTLYSSHRRQGNRIGEHLNRSWDFSRSTAGRDNDTSFDETASLGNHSDLTPTLNLSHRRASSAYKSLQPHCSDTMTNFGPTGENKVRLKADNSESRPNVKLPDSHLSKSDELSDINNPMMSNSRHNSLFDSECSKDLGLVMTKNKQGKQKRSQEKLKKSEKSSTCSKQKDSAEESDHASNTNSVCKLRRSGRHMKSDIGDDKDKGNSSGIDEDNTSRVECKKALSAYENHRHLEPSCTQPIDCKDSVSKQEQANVTIDIQKKDSDLVKIPTKDKVSEKYEGKINKSKVSKDENEISNQAKRQKRKRFRSGSDSNIILSHKRNYLSPCFLNDVNVINSDSSAHYTNSNQVSGSNTCECVGVSQSSESRVVSKKANTETNVINGKTKSPVQVSVGDKTDYRKVKYVNKLKPNRVKLQSKMKTTKRRSWPRVDKKELMIQKLHKTLAKFDLNDGKFGAVSRKSKTVGLQLSELETIMPLSGIDSGAERQAKNNSSIKQKGVMHRNQDSCAIWEGVMSKFV